MRIFYPSRAQMKTVEYILKVVTPNSLIIVDELCRSTNPIEGAQLAWSLCEHLAAVRGLFNNGDYYENNHIIRNDSTISSSRPTDASRSVRQLSSLTRISNWKGSKLCEVTAPFVFLTTHYTRLTRLADFHFNIFK